MNEKCWNEDILPEYKHTYILLGFFKCFLQFRLEILIILFSVIRILINYPLSVG